MDDTQGRRRTQAVPRRVTACPWDIVRAHPQRQEVEHVWSVEGGEWLPVEAASPFGATRRFQKQIERGNDCKAREYTMPLTCVYDG